MFKSKCIVNGIGESLNRPSESESVNGVAVHRVVEEGMVVDRVALA